MIKFTLEQVLKDNDMSIYALAKRKQEFVRIPLDNG